MREMIASHVAATFLLTQIVTVMELHALTLPPRRQLSQRLTRVPEQTQTLTATFRF